MKNISKWLMAGTFFAVAFGCQCQTNASDESKDNPSQDEQKSGECSQRAKTEKAAPASPTAAAAAKMTPAPVAEKKAGPISAPAIRVVEQGGVPAVKENPIASPALGESKSATPEAPLSSGGPVVAPTSEVKAEVTTKTPAPVNQVGNVTENQSASK